MCDDYILYSLMLAGLWRWLWRWLLRHRASHLAATTSHACNTEDDQEDDQQASSADDDEEDDNDMDEDDDQPSSHEDDEGVLPRGKSAALAKAVGKILDAAAARGGDNVVLAVCVVEVAEGSHVLSHVLDATQQHTTLCATPPWVHLPLCVPPPSRQVGQQPNAQQRKPQQMQVHEKPNGCVRN